MAGEAAEEVEAAGASSQTIITETTMTALLRPALTEGAVAEEGALVRRTIVSR